MRVVLTIAGLSPEFGGPSQSVPALAEALANENVEVDLFTCGAQPGYGAPALPDPAVVRTTLLPVRSRLRQWRSRGNDFFHAVCDRSQGKDAVIHDNGLWLPTNHAVAAAARFSKQPFLISPRGMLGQWAMSYHRWKKRVAWRWFQQKDLFGASALHVTSERELADARRVGFRGPVAVIPNGISLPETSKEWATDTRQGDGEIRTAIFVGRIHPVKGLLDLIEAWSAVRPNGWRMVIAGGDETGHRAETEAAVANRGLVHVFDFVGPLDRKRRQALYKNADLFVFPSYSENFGLAIAEALANEIPVITTKGTPWKDLIDYGCGWWEEIGPEPLARALHEATRLHDETRRKMGQRGRELVAMKYSWPEIAGKMTSVYKWLLGHGEMPACIAPN